MGPGLTPILQLKPGYAPPSGLSSTPNRMAAAAAAAGSSFAAAATSLAAVAPSFAAAAPSFAAATPSFAAQPAYGAPQPAYTPAPYSPPAPVGPVLLESKPYAPKSVEALPISVSETYTNFDCRSKPYPGRHYADVEAGCEVYHFCHEDGKQDTFQCGYGTVFNEYIGTCDFKSSVQCNSGDGFAAATSPYPC